MSAGISTPGFRISYHPPRRDLRKRQRGVRSPRGDERRLRPAPLRVEDLADPFSVDEIAGWILQRGGNLDVGAELPDADEQEILVVRPFGVELDLGVLV